MASQKMRRRRMSDGGFQGPGRRGLKLSEVVHVTDTRRMGGKWDVYGIPLIFQGTRGRSKRKDGKTCVKLISIARYLQRIVR